MKRNFIDDLILFFSILLYFLSFYFGLKTEQLIKTIYVLLIPLIICGVLFLITAIHKNLKRNEHVVILPDNIEIKNKRKK